MYSNASEILGFVRRVSILELNCFNFHKNFLFRQKAINITILIPFLHTPHFSILTAATTTSCYRLAECKILN